MIVFIYSHYTRRRRRVADARLGKGRRMSVLLVRDFAAPQTETKQMRPYASSQLQGVFLRQLFKRRQAAADKVGADAIGDADVAFAPETIGRDDQNIQLFGFLRKLVAVAGGRLDKQVERAGRIGASEAHLGQCGIEDVPVFTIDVYVGGQAVALLDQTLEQSGRANVAEGATCPAYGKLKLLLLGRQGGNRNVADPLTGVGEGFGIGIANDGVVIVLGKARRLFVI